MRDVLVHNAPKSSPGTSKNHFDLSYHTAENTIYDGGGITRISKKEFLVLKGLAFESISLLPGCLRTPHSHPNANQLNYCVIGIATVGLIRPDAQQQCFEVKTGEIYFIPQGYITRIENRHTTNLKVVSLFSNEGPETMELSDTLAIVPKAILSKVFGIPEESLKDIPMQTVKISGGKTIREQRLKSYL